MRLRISEAGEITCVPEPFSCVARPICHGQYANLTDSAQLLPAFLAYLLQSYGGLRIALSASGRGAMMSEGIAFLLILASATGGPWLATIIVAKAKRCHGRRVI